jgi:hypothetical protein
LMWARSVKPLPLYESMRPCANDDSGVRAATKQIAATTHAHLIEERKRVQDHPETSFIRPLPRSQFKPTVCQAEIFSAYKRSLVAEIQCAIPCEAIGRQNVMPANGAGMTLEASQSTATDMTIPA